MFKTKALFKTQNLALAALLIAANVVLSRFLSINLWNLKIGFTFLTVVFAAYFLGPVAAALVGGLGDLIGALLFPIGAYFPGFTLTAILTGLCFGFFLHQKISLPKICLSVAINELIGSLLINTLWISILYGSDFKALFLTRLLTQVLPMLVIETLVIQLIFGKSMMIQQLKTRLKKN